MQLHDVVETSRRTGSTTRRRDKVAFLAELLRGADPTDADIAIAFLSGELRQGRVGLGYAAVQAAREASPVDTPQLDLAEVDRVFGAIAGMSGPGSNRDKVGALRDMFARATDGEQRFLSGLVMGEIRQGALHGLMVEAVASAVDMSARTLRRSVMLAGGLRPVAAAVLREGRAGLAQFSLQLFQPLQPMLAQPASDVADALERLDTPVLEYKLDGARIQVHKGDDEIRVYSRRLHDVTAAVPEIVTAVRSLPVRDVILDGEAIALRADGTPHPFQVTMRRFGRKIDIAKAREATPLTPAFFDLIRVDGEDILDAPLRDRLARLDAVVGNDLVVPRSLAADTQAAEDFLTAARRAGHEGIMAKAGAAPYEAGSRGASWLKIKPAHTLDLVVLAAEWGHGRRRGWLSNLHLGARDPENGGFVMLGKTFKGMTDEMLAWQTERLQELAVAREQYVVHVRPELVVEVAFNDVQASPHYPAGLALRFARIKQYRGDKTAADADTVGTVREIYAKAVGESPI